MLGKLFILILILANIGCDQLEKAMGGKKAKTTANHIEPGPVRGTFAGDQSFITYSWINAPGNGWFANVSPDGNYVGSGFPGIQVADLRSKSIIPIQGGACYSARWIRPGVLTYVCNINDSNAYRMEALVGSWQPYQTSDTPSLVAGNQFQASDGHWASWLGGRGIAYDNMFLDSGYGVSQNETWVGFAPNNNNDQLMMYNNGQFHGSFYPQSAMGEWDVLDGRAAYGGHGPTWGYSEQDGDLDLTIAPGGYEGSVQLIRVGDSIWVATSAWVFAQNKGYVLIRPWNDRAAIIIQAEVADSHVVFNGSEFVVATTTDKGSLSVYKVPVNAPRYTF